MPSKSVKMWDLQMKIQKPKPFLNLLSLQIHLLSNDICRLVMHNTEENQKETIFCSLNGKCQSYRYVQYWYSLKFILIYSIMNGEVPLIKFLVLKRNNTSKLQLVWLSSNLGKENQFKGNSHSFKDFLNFLLSQESIWNCNCWKMWVMNLCEKCLQVSYQLNNLWI